MKNRILLITASLIFSLSFGQKKITWENLADVEFTEKYFPNFGETFLYPKFSEALKNIEGTKVSLVGYFLDVDPEGKMFVLSKGPMASCFFCGAGGPETAVEIQFISEQDFKTDQIIKVTGVLKLNADDVEHFNYILTESTAEFAE